MCFLKKTAVIMATSPHLINSSYYLQKFKDKTLAVPLSINPTDYEKTARIEKKIQKIQKLHPKYALFVGRLVHYKGVEVLLKALKGSNVPIVMIGKGPLKEKIKKLSTLTEFYKITLLEPQPFEDLLAYLWASNFLILPSIQNSEAFGIVQLEAMICKKPVVSTKLPTGVSYVNINKETGFLVEPKNVEKLNKAIIRLYKDNELCTKMGQNAYKRVKDLFTENKMMESIIKVYKNF
jgi:rhamnosyl/mannosyltransferase